MGCEEGRQMAGLRQESPRETQRCASRRLMAKAAAAAERQSGACRKVQPPGTGTEGRGGRLFQQEGPARENVEAAARRPAVGTTDGREREEEGESSEETAGRELATAGRTRGTAEGAASEGERARRGHGGAEEEGREQRGGRGGRGPSG